MKLKVLFGLCLLSAGISLPGCSTTPQMELAEIKPVVVTVDDYPKAFEIAIATLKTEYFLIDRQDRRFGVITTKPRDSTTVFEPWGHGKVNGLNTLTATLNKQRRAVRIIFMPLTINDDISNDNNKPTPEGYQIKTEVLVQQRQHPTSPLTSAVVSATSYRSRYRYVSSTEIQDAGVIESYWQDLGRDKDHEAVILKRIAKSLMD